MLQLAFVIVSILLGPVQPVQAAASGCPTTALSDIQHHRAEYGKVVFLFGDSIVRGWALATFTPPEDHPLWCLRSPEAVLATLRDENSLSEFAFVSMGGTELVQPSVVADYIASGTIQNGDIIVVEDAGDRPHPPQAYRERLLGVRQVATVDHTITVVVMTTPDFIDLIRHPELESYRWSVEVDGTSHNAALRQGATEPIPGAIGRTTLVDWQCHAHQARENLLQEQGLDIFHDDGIHPNILGQLQFVGLILDAVGVPVEHTRRVEQIALADIDNLAREATFRSKTWRNEHAVRWVNHLLTQPRACPE